MKHPRARWPYLLGTAALAGVTCAGYSVGVAMMAGVSPWIAGPVTGVLGAAFVGHAIYKWGPSEPEPARDQLSEPAADAVPFLDVPGAGAHPDRHRDSEQQRRGGTDQG